VKADPQAQQRLLDLQALDLDLDRLRHRHDASPLIARLRTAAVEVTRLRDAAVAARTRLGDTERELRKAEADVDTVVARANRDRSLLDGGTITAAGQLTSLQGELASLERRQSSLEDVVLEVMERVEAAGEDVTAAQAALDAGEAALADIRAERDAEVAEIEREQARVVELRGAKALDVPEDLRKLYESIRGKKGNGGIGAAELHRARCQGCNLTLNPIDLEDLRKAPANLVTRCEECQRILVRTERSGLWGPVPE
jgi:hypothetical protein